MSRILKVHTSRCKVLPDFQWIRGAILSLGMASLSIPLLAQSNTDADIEQHYTNQNSLQPVSLDSLTKDQAIALTLSRSRELQSLETNVQIANYRLQSSGKIRNPELRISEESAYEFTSEFDETRVGFRWRAPRLGQLAEEKQQARVDVWTRKVRAQRFREQLVAKVRRNYADVIMQDRLVELAQKRIDLETQRLNIVDQMVNLGRRTVVYQTKAKMWHAESQNDYNRIVQRQHMERRKLARRTGTPEDIPLVFEPLPEVTQELDQLITIAFSNRAEMELVQQRIDLAVKQYALEHRKIIPWLTFIDLSYHIERQPRPSWAEFRLGINIPVFDWNRGNAKATKLAVTRKEGESDAIREEIEGEVRDAYTIYMDFLLDWKNFSRDVEQMIENADTVIEQAQQHQTLQPDEVLEMELTIIETQQLLCERRRRLAHALVDLYYAMGIEGPEKLNQVEGGE